MDKAEISKKVKEIIIKSLGLKKDSSEIIGQDLIAELGINSIDALEIFVWIENTFEIQISDEDLSAELIASLEGLTDYIYNKKQLSA
ncbi:MAG: acyl carrier protein [Caulobacteraceae bacterium]